MIKIRITLLCSLIAICLLVSIAFFSGSAGITGNLISSESMDKIRFDSSYMIGALVLVSVVCLIVCILFKKYDTQN